MNPQWISAAVAGAGLLGNLAWMVFNLRLENRILQLETRLVAHVDALKEWADSRFVRAEDLVANDRCKPSPAARQAAIFAKSPFSGEI